VLAAMHNLSSRADPLDWASCVLIGSEGENAVAGALAHAGWTTLLHGEARADCPPPKLRTARGFLGASDLLAWPPCGGRPWSIEAKHYRQMIKYPGWGFCPEEFKALAEHDRIAGPVLLAIVSQEDGQIWVVSFADLQNHKPKLTNNQRCLVLLGEYFIPLSQFIDKYKREYTL